LQSSSVPIEENVVQATGPLLEYDKEKYREMILDAVETDLSIFGFDGRRIYGNPRKKNKGRIIGNGSGGCKD
jgi:hypothetical protein